MLCKLYDKPIKDQKIKINTVVMTKLLEKAVKDAIKKRKPTIGTKQVMHSMKSSKLIVISQTVPNEKTKKVEKNAKNNNVPILNFEGSSVALGKLCGLQFRVSAISLDSLSNTNAQAILKEYEAK
uniref:Ribosomal protein L7Ae/L30e/S12e/Gadd45 (RP-L30e, RPL30) n=1 Tax=uncultured marine thaumarchaeote KM3_144_G01 TaxID=1456010 RepID=A0A075GAU4_9ARCH|nr:ribosomal protein L7Ae/L30e/S12e/Gadd45 (RP-L30e, RPL30) [uncultured marine thaumarchaeote KM3_144_G01]